MGVLKIHKMTGSGNDFVLVDNREGLIAEKDIPGLAQGVCTRRLSVGADGLILIEHSSTADFRMRIINADGSEAEMCGNGSRCIALLAQELGIVSGKMKIDTVAGSIEAEVKDDTVAVRMTDVQGVEKVSLECEQREYELLFLDSGVPHAIVFVEDLDSQDVAGVGRAIRRHSRFQPQGTNVNFVKGDSGPEISIRTYERGVEDETLACGTGATASAIAYSYSSGQAPPIAVTTRSGDILTISFTCSGDGFRQVMMEGPVKKVFEGTYAY